MSKLMNMIAMTCLVVLGACVTEADTNDTDPGERPALSAQEAAGEAGILTFGDRQYMADGREVISEDEAAARLAAVDWTVHPSDRSTATPQDDQGGSCSACTIDPYCTRNPGGHGVTCRAHQQCCHLICDGFGFCTIQCAIQECHDVGSSWNF